MADQARQPSLRDTTSPHGGPSTPTQTYGANFSAWWTEHANQTYGANFSAWWTKHANQTYGANQTNGPVLPPMVALRSGPPTDNQSKSELIRIAPADYGDGKGSLSGADRPGAREISNTVSKQDGNTVNQKGASDLFWGWGQFLDHDITLTETNKHDSANIPVPKGDAKLDPFSTGKAEIPFERTDSITDGKGVRQQLNTITSAIDGSQVYGSTDTQTDKLRSFTGGKLKTSGDNLLPTDEKGNFMAGDKRVNEQPGLTSLHTLFMREHNRMADQIAKANPSWGDSKIFDTARKNVTHKIQSITKNEFLPTLLGSNSPTGKSGYNPHADPRISNSFSAAGYRFGHSLVSPTIPIEQADGSTKHVALMDAFMNPGIVKKNGIDGILGGQSKQTSQALDPAVIEDLRSALFGPSRCRRNGSCGAEHPAWS